MLFQQMFKKETHSCVTCHVSRGQEGATVTVLERGNCMIWNIYAGAAFRKPESAVLAPSIQRETSEAASLTFLPRTVIPSPSFSARR